MEIFEKIPDVLIQFLMVLVFSLLIGLEQRRLQSEKHHKLTTFGTDRTFSFIGIFGFLLYIIDPKNLFLFAIGAIVIGILFVLYYYEKMILYRSFGLTSIIAALLTYCIGPIVITQPKWLSILIVVTILILVEVKDYLQEFSTRIDNNEFITLAKFLIIAGVILPILPSTPIVNFISLTPHEIWLSVVVVSSISYLSYLLQKFVFKKSGIIISGILGGLYSSTATTLILARKSKIIKSENNQYGAAIIFATGLMYARILLLMLIFNNSLGILLLPSFLILIFISATAGLTFYFLKKPPQTESDYIVHDKNPLELKIASIFAVLFIFFTFITYYTFQYYGNSGLNILSYIVGLTDIDPYLINLFQGKFNIPLFIIGKSALQAIIANNILKILYVVFLGDKRTYKIVIGGIGIVTIINVIIMLLM